MPCGHPTKRSWTTLELLLATCPHSGIVLPPSPLDTRTRKTSSLEQSDNNNNTLHCLHTTALYVCPVSLHACLWLCRTSSESQPSTTTPSVKLC